ncbi:MAG TPA: discoidin domain-containing protein, partial [Chthonomonadales bacterium]|nr:discoidin domain-containing protein [Chthonomonadales bacterium]
MTMDLPLRLTVLMLLVLAWASAQLNEPPLVNVALTASGTRVTADTQFSDRHAGANAADGRLTRGEGNWYSRDQTRLPCALTFELPAAEEIRRVVLHQARWDGNMYRTRDFAIEVSEDGAAWRRVATGTLADDSEARAELDVRERTRWLRVVVLTSYNDFQTCGLAEVELLAERALAAGTAQVLLNGAVARPSAPSGGMSLLGGARGPQAAVWRSPSALLAVVRPGEEVALRLPVLTRGGELRATARVELEGAGAAEARLEAFGVSARRSLGPAERGATLRIDAEAPAGDAPLTLRIRGREGEAAVRLRALTLQSGGRSVEARLGNESHDWGEGNIPTWPNPRPALQRAMIEWDWRMQDGIGTERRPVSYADAVARSIARGRRLSAERGRAGDLALWQTFVREAAQLRARRAPDAEWERLYLRVRWVRRERMLAGIEREVGPLVFVKQAPGVFSHQLTQYYGRYARPGGGVFVLDRPGVSMNARPLVQSALPAGSFMHPEVSWDGRRVLFAFCPTDRVPADRLRGQAGRFYSLYSVGADGSGLRRLTRGAYDDFSPRFLPNGQIVFISTRRGGWHRCGYPGCETYTLALAEADGSQPRTLSFHETNEWDPAVLHDGRIIYTRWDYVNRHPVFYQHLWTTHPDGTGAAAYYGNNTFNPIGLWEARPVPGSHRVMATAGAHHAMTAGSIVLVDVSKGVDGPAPIRRLTPDAPFPESETVLSPNWHYPMPGTRPHTTPESERWPGHCYRSPYPLSETRFLVAYSYDTLIGEPGANPPNMFGLYLADAHGNRELLHRDPNISSLWPVPLRPRQRPPVLSPRFTMEGGREGVFVMQDVYAGLTGVERGTVKAIRVLQVLPKTTPGMDRPPIGLPSGAPGVQVLGTVPVEADGSAAFRVPSRVQVAFQALDRRNMAVQVMRSGTYLQPGERASCVGCHEPRALSPGARRPLAKTRPPSTLRPGPDGSRPFSYPLLVQPVLDRRCVGCHAGPRPPGGVRLTGEPEGHYTASYNALAPRVAFSDLNNAEAVSRPGRFGAVGSPL